jgi:hypothetical protein
MYKTRIVGMGRDEVWLDLSGPGPLTLQLSAGQQWPKCLSMRISWKLLLPQLPFAFHSRPSYPELSLYYFSTRLFSPGCAGESFLPR